MLARDLFGQCKNSRLFYDVNVACLMAMLDNSSEILMNAYMYTFCGVFFRGGGDVLIFVVKKSACFRLCLLGVGSFQFKKEGIDKRKIFTNTSFSVEKIIQFKCISNKRGSRDRIDV